MADPSTSKQEYRMARRVKIDTTDDVVNLSLNVWVHKHLVYGISNETKELVVKYEDRKASARKGEPGSTDSDIFVLPKDFDYEPSLELWSGFLYGQPIWEYSGKHNVDDNFDVLIEVHTFAEKYKHFDAQDASIDALRDIVSNHSDALTSPFTSVFCRGDCTTSLPVKMLMDHVAHGDRIFLAQHWIEEYIDTGAEPDAVAMLEHHLCQVLLVKVEEDRAGHEPPDLMTRCRYHSHIEHDYHAT